LGGVLATRNLSQSLALPTKTIRVAGTPQVVFTNPITIIHMNMIVNRPLMSSMATRRYKCASVTNSRGKYQEPSSVIAHILDHKNGHYVRPNKVALKYPDFKKDVDLNVHVKVFNFTIKVNAKTSEEYIINVISYMLKDTTLDWCHNYMIIFSGMYISILQTSLEDSK
jgi:hypothetical protein